MVTPGRRPQEPGRPEERAEIMTKPLPQILDEMEGAIRAAAAVSG